MKSIIGEIKRMDRAFDQFWADHKIGSLIFIVGMAYVTVFQIREGLDLLEQSAAIEMDIAASHAASDLRDMLDEARKDRIPAKWGMVMPRGTIWRSCGWYGLKDGRATKHFLAFEDGLPTDPGGNLAFVQNVASFLTRGNAKAPQPILEPRSTTLNGVAIVEGCAVPRDYSRPALLISMEETP